MGKGDKRSFKGKLFRASYGNTRPRHPKPKTDAAGATPATARKK